jgi:hypothetical protein
MSENIEYLLGRQPIVFERDVILQHYCTSCRSRDSVVGIATSYELDDRGVRVRVPVG